MVIYSDCIFILYKDTNTMLKFSLNDITNQLKIDILKQKFYLICFLGFGYIICMLAFKYLNIS